ncbi:superinfection immunity protein [Paraburkholderia sp. DHOC27]|uniref:superinfection immunity protein n=1 Tax=Paraburkholderia sp. DHOC27 TaxID=2303330 RepID=UPI000E3D8D89|nr:superinfection immunity protein [Paraburkholderia sp. DHOC27]RFU44813.1 superinfection immunity protein [Paraburkholderia sp. DHOC27]
MSQILEGITVLGVLTLYLIPSIEADARKSRDAQAITLVNVLLGWTVIGWIAAFMWARRPEVEKRMARLVRRTQRAEARGTIARIVAHAEHRAALQGRLPVRRRVLTDAVL